MTLSPPPRIPEETRAAVIAIAAASGLRVRQILLRDNWWNEYSGPMVAFRKEDGLPVALIRAGATGYRIQLPSGGKPVRVTSAKAGELTGAAFLFYRPFPMRSLALKDLLAFGLKGCGPEVGLMILTGIAAGALGLAAPLAFGALFDHAIPNAQRGQVVLLGALVALSAVCTMLFTIAGGFAALRVEARIASSMQTALWDRLLSLPVSFFRSYTSGDLASRSVAVDRIRQTLTGPILTSAMAAVLSSFQIAILFFYSARMALIALALLAVAFAVTTVLGAVQVHSQRKITRIQGRISGILSELLGGISKIRVAGAEMRAFAYWAESFSARSREWAHARGFASALTTFNSAFPTASLALVYWAGLHFMQADGGARIKTGEFLAFTASFHTLLLAVLQVSSAVVSGLVIVPEYERLRPILETAPESAPGKTEAPELAGDIEISHVTFRYRPDQLPALRDVSLRVNQGEFVAIVGESGCGKSTLLRILLGFEEPQSGAVYYDNHALNGLNLASVRRQMGVVLQSGRLMAGSIVSNIARTLPLSPEQVLEAARLAGLEDELKEMPMGMHTILSDGGGGLSGGQRQRVLIARAIVNQPRILIFDEATSALDNRSQALISERLACLNATRIVIAHRLSTIRHADRIVVMQNGEFRQSGTYEQLTSQPGLFSELAARQTLR
jgi:ATP-binding cassette subfamily C protein